MMTLVSLIDSAKSHNLTYHIITPAISRVKVPPFNTQIANPDILFLLNFTTSQRSALLTAKSTLALLYTPTNEHFGIGPVEGWFVAFRSWRAIRADLRRALSTNRLQKEQVGCGPQTPKCGLSLWKKLWICH